MTVALAAGRDLCAPAAVTGLYLSEQRRGAEPRRLDRSGDRRGHVATLDGGRLPVHSATASARHGHFRRVNIYPAEIEANQIDHSCQGF